MKEILYPGYLVPLYHFPPASHEPIEFPSLSLGSGKAQALEGEVVTVLEKEATEMVENSGLSHSQLFLSRRWKLVINLLSLNTYYPNKIQNGDCFLGLVGYEEGGKFIPRD